VLEHQQTQHHLGRDTRPAAFTALRMPLGQRLVHCCDNLRVTEQLIGVFHPRFMQVLHFFGDQSVTEAALRTVCLNHAWSSCDAAQRRPAATVHG
jgi:hypothetical protein